MNAKKNTAPLMQRRGKTERMVITAMFAAIICVATMVIHIPSPLGGYVNLGDTVVLLAAFLLGPASGAVAAGIGSMFADIFLGFTQYAIITLIVKSAMALVAGAIFLRLTAGGSKPRRLTAAMASGFLAECIMVGGYYLFALLVLRETGALLTIPPNVIQGLVGIAGASALLLMLPAKLL